MTEFKEFEIEYALAPVNFSTPRLMFVKAASKEDAEEIARDQIRRRSGEPYFRIFYVRQTTPVPAGEVVRS